MPYMYWVFPFELIWKFHQSSRKSKIKGEISGAFLLVFSQMRGKICAVLWHHRFHENHLDISWNDENSERIKPYGNFQMKTYSKNGVIRKNSSISCSFPKNEDIMSKRPYTFVFFRRTLFYFIELHMSVQLTGKNFL